MKPDVDSALGILRQGEVISIVEAVMNQVVGPDHLRSLNFIA
jgi:hypothetical protein